MPSFLSVTYLRKVNKASLTRSRRPTQHRSKRETHITLTEIALSMSHQLLTTVASQAKSI